MKVTALSKAAILAYEFILTPKNMFVSPRANRVVRPASFGPDRQQNLPNPLHMRSVNATTVTKKVI